MKSYVLSSEAGLVLGACFFLAFSAAIAIAIYVLLTRPTVRRPRFGTWTIRKGVAAPFAALTWLVLFSAIYLSSLAGFHTITVGDRGVRMEFAVPSRTVALRYAEIGDVIRRPAFKMLWRLEIYTLAGGRFESAPGSYSSIREAAHDIELRLRR